MHPNLISASLYVGDLAPEVAENELLDIFNQCGPVASIRVLRDMMTRRSLGYAYVNYHQVSDAERALDTINYMSVRGKPLRIMWKHRDPAKRKSGVGNIFIKNLDKSIDSRTLNDTFSQFGNILSCKVATDEHGQSKGYGFVQYETKEAAETAIEKVNGNLIEDKRVSVAHFLPLAERQTHGQPKYTNVFVKNLELSVTKEQLHEAFAKYGAITSAVVMLKDDGTSRGFGFVNFETADQARAAVDALNKTKVFGDNEIHVGKAEKAQQRQQELRKQWALRKQEMQSKFSGTNLYVKNLDDTVSDDVLRTLFEPFGTITSCKVEKDETGKSKGFGYVCFHSPEDATRALTTMNNSMHNQKPIYVALHQSREIRREMLRAQNLRHQQFPPQSMRLQQMPMMYPNQGRPYFMMQHPAMGRGGFPGMRPAVPMQGGGRGGFGGGRGGAGGGGRPAGVPMGVPQPGQPGGPGQRGIKFQPGVRNRDQMQGQPAQQMPQTIAPGALSKEQLASMLVTATNEQQKQLLGERLYALIAPSQPTLTGKITGMLLEGLDNGELLHLIDSPEALQAKIQEAISALHAHMQEAGTA